MKFPAWSIDRRLWQILIFGALAVFIISSRMQHRDHYLYSWDSVQFALSIEHFDVAKHQPHPPGYLLYSYSLKFLNKLISDPNLTAILLNIAATLGACMFVVLLLYEFTGNWFVAAGAAWIFATNSLAWFYGCVAEIYAVEAFFSAATCYFVIASFRRPPLLIWGAAIISIAGGFRPTTEVFLLPFFLCGLYRKKPRTIAATLIVLIAINAAWIAVLVSLTGGISRYVEIVSRQAAMSSEIAGVPLRMMPLLLLQAITLPVFITILLLSRRVRFDAKLMLLLLAPLPAIGFYLFQLFGKEGYLLIAVVPFIATSIILLQRVTGSGLLFVVAILTGCILNQHMFVKPPHYEQPVTGMQTLIRDFCTPNRHAIRAHELRLETFLKTVNGIPGKKAFVFNGFYFPDWRTVSYYKPDDQAILLQPARRRALVAIHHAFEMEKPAFEIDRDAEMLICISSEEPGLPMKKFEDFEYRYFYAAVSDLPERFKLYSLRFEVKE